MIERFMTLTGVIESCWKIVMVGSSGEREIKEVVFEYNSNFDINFNECIKFGFYDISFDNQFISCLCKIIRVV